MKTRWPLAALALLLISPLGYARVKPAKTTSPVPEVVELTFGTEVTAADDLPAWFRGVEQKSGQYLPDDGGWRVGADSPFGSGRLEFILDRGKTVENLALTLFYSQREADIAIQLYDEQDRVVVVDLFANVVEVNEYAKTDTAIIPLNRYPTASKVVIRRLQGEINVRGAVLFPVVSETEIDRATLKQLSTLLGDPLSDTNPLLAGLAGANRRADKAEALDATPVARESGIKVLQGTSEVAAPGAERQLVKLRISGRIDGSDEVHIDRDGAEWVHKHWGYPSRVTLNGIPWKPSANGRIPNQGGTQFLPRPVDFASAQVLLAKGRDVCAMVPTKDKIIIFFADSPNGESDYEMLIAFEALDPIGARP